MDYVLVAYYQPLRHKHLSEDGYTQELKIEAQDDQGAVVGEALFLVHSEWLWPELVQVAPGYRRKGIASAIYAKAEAMTSLSIKKPDDHSEDAEAFWRNR